ncbi:hypothetical protein B0H14DRAFT_2681436 [Mycena olivaceomarginata]|nr:hypothetical protein B0H14DRAFT_2681436 [Mycena olivaceomarginata]
MSTKMRAVVYDKPFSVSVREVEKPTILHPDDIIVKATCTCTKARTAAQAGIVFGHEKKWEPVVTLLKKGDRVVMPFNVACGRCLNCEEGRSAFCTLVNPGLSYVAMGPYPGGQAVCVPFLKTPIRRFLNALVLPSGKEHEEDFALLADIFPTGWHGIHFPCGFRPGESVVVFGAGPVGLMAAYSAVPARCGGGVRRRPRARAARQGEGDWIKALRGGSSVGYQATTGDGKTEQPNAVIEALIAVVRPTGGLGIPGLYVPSDPGAPDAASAKGYISFPFGKLFEKGLTVGTGQCNVKAYNRYLRDLIIAGRAKPSFVVSHNVSLDDAADAYVKFDKRIDGYTKVLLHP